MDSGLPISLTWMFILPKNPYLPPSLRNNGRSYTHAWPTASSLTGRPVLPLTSPGVLGEIPGPHPGPPHTAPLRPAGAPGWDQWAADQHQHQHWQQHCYPHCLTASLPHCLTARTILTTDDVFFVILVFSLTKLCPSLIFQYNMGLYRCSIVKWWWRYSNIQF